MLIRVDIGKWGDKMVLELKQGELNRLNDLLSNEWMRKRPYIPRPNKIQINAYQVQEVKLLLAVGVSMVDIQNTTGLSDYVRGVRRGRYDFLLDAHHTPYREPPRR